LTKSEGLAAAWSDLERTFEVGMVVFNEDADMFTAAES
jgi:hypothetical protein